MWSNGTLDVTLVEPNAAFVSCPLSNLVLGGSKQIADLTVSYDGLAKRGIKVVCDTAHGRRSGPRHRAHLEPAASFPTTAWCCRRASTSSTTRCRGSAAPTRRRRCCTRGRPVRRPSRCARQLEAMRDGGVFAISIPKRALPLPARAVRARLPGRVVLQAREAAQQGADPRRQRGRACRRRACS